MTGYTENGSSLTPKKIYLRVDTCGLITSAWVLVVTTASKVKMRIQPQKLSTKCIRTQPVLMRVLMCLIGLVAFPACDNDSPSDNAMLLYAPDMLITGQASGNTQSKNGDRTDSQSEPANTVPTDQNNDSELNDPTPTGLEGSPMASPSDEQSPSSSTDEPEPGVGQTDSNDDSSNGAGSPENDEDSQTSDGGAPSADENIPGAGLVCCGDAGDVCDLEVEFCCSNWFGQECKAECNAGLDKAQACDGAEDCDNGDVCCAQPDGLVARSFASSCKVACLAGEYEVNSSMGCGINDADGMNNPDPAPGQNNGNDPVGDEQMNQPDPNSPDDDDGQDPNDPDRDNGQGDDPLPNMDGDCGLVVRAMVRDEGGPCERCTAGEYITLVGIVENPCNVPLVYRSPRDCLVSEFVVLNLEFQTSAAYPMTCRMDDRREELAPGDSITQTRPAGRLSANPYELSIQFENPERALRTLRFTVE